MRTPIDRLAILLMIVGAINWLTVGLFGVDFVAGIFGGVDALGSRIIYSIVGIAGIYSISLLFREAPAAEYFNIQYLSRQENGVYTPGKKGACQ